MTVDDPLLDTEVGRYRIVRLLGEGGMGRVYEGVRFESGAIVAIKVLSERYATDGSLVERFFAEARATSLIAHENIVQVHDLAKLPDGRPYIVMERLVGTTLRSLIDDEPLPVGGVLHAAIEVLTALAATHAKGIVHRDLKPDNIFITTKGRTKVLDFGIAKLTGANAISRTQTGVVLGTPEYMAPEHITHGVSDARSDLYSLGVVLFEALTGRRPFEAPNDFDLMRAHVEDAPPAPRKFRTDLPAALDDILACALAKDARERFASANAMAATLRQVTGRVSLEQWRPLVPGGRLPSPRPPSAPAVIDLPSARRDDQRSAATLSDRPSGAPRLDSSGAPRSDVSGASRSDRQPRDAAARQRRARGFVIVGLVAAAGAGALVTRLAREERIAPVVTATPTATRSVPIATSSTTVTSPGASADAEAPPAPSITTASAPPRSAAPHEKRREPPTYDPKDFNWTRFDWQGYLPTATAFARLVSEDAVWITLSLEGVSADGTVDLSRGSGLRTFYAFRSLKDKPVCHLAVRMTPAGPSIQTMNNVAACDEQPIVRQRCTLRQVHARAVAAGAGTRDQFANVTRNAVGWVVEMKSSAVFADDCKDDS